MLTAKRSSCVALKALEESIFQRRLSIHGRGFTFETLADVIINQNMGIIGAIKRTDVLSDLLSQPPNHAPTCYSSRCETLKGFK